jgi:hypothetical protein
VAIAPSAQAISYAIAIEAVTPHIDSMIARGSVSRPDLGLIPITITPSIAASFDLESDRGILALHVDPSKPAGQAGLQSGDVVTAIDNRPLYNMGGFLACRDSREWAHGLSRLHTRQSRNGKPSRCHDRICHGPNDDASPPAPLAGCRPRPTTGDRRLE